MYLEIGVTCSNCYAYLGSGITIIVEYDGVGKSRAQAGAVGAEIMLGGVAGTIIINNYYALQLYLFFVSSTRFIYVNHLCTFQNEKKVLELS